ncbi:hypothetical protein [Rhizobium sp. P28RR-XV]|uniref:hypothetical protein n=1 Tax=Rhizobium sp. P28RR-XV TaxID=2726737 RepID=UPI0014576559|nr:hypothetical protein [Rhizobium sp. P28RR-XV]NLR86148.1 hypothetical protein [Rhizobium sp. P28RR-XV]
MTESKDDDVEAVYFRSAFFAHDYYGVELLFRTDEFRTTAWMMEVDAQIAAKMTSVFVETMKITTDKCAEV